MLHNAQQQATSDGNSVVRVCVVVGGVVGGAMMTHHELHAEVEEYTAG